MSVRRLLYILPVLAFALAAILIWLRLGADPAIMPSALLDRAVPQFDLAPLLADRPGLKTADLQGQVALVNLFASWCVPCRIEHPILMRLKEKDGVAIYGINYKDDPDAARRWLDQLGNPFARIGVDGNGRAAIEWGVTGVPETFVVDRQGRVRYRHVGPIQARDLDETIIPLLKTLNQ
jgi:cytochrome c biogenesis protein CcmG, thiol:disulfide interchange protein DsbE